MARLAAFYDAFLDAVIERRSAALVAFVEARATPDNAIVYRNTVFCGGANALATAFPSVARLAGADYFEAVAVAYVEAHPPRSRTLAGYGSSFPEFLQAAPGIENAPYLPDVARLDRAWLAAHLAVDETPLTADALGEGGPEHLAAKSLPLHASVQLVNLSWDIHDVWRANRAEGDASCDTRAVSCTRQGVAIWRPQHEVRSQVLALHEAEFLAAMAEGCSLSVAASRALKIDSNFDVSQMFAGAIAAGVFAPVAYPAHATPGRPA